jgi:hypothetical protein
MKGKEWLEDPRVQLALEDFERLIRERYPEATFKLSWGGEPDGVYLTTEVDLEDTLEVLDANRDRLFEVQVEEERPVYVIPVRPAWSEIEKALNRSSKS